MYIECRFKTSKCLAVKNQRKHNFIFWNTTTQLNMYNPISSIQSKLPQVGTTIFTRMSQLAQQHQAINLAQGFPEFDCDVKLQELVHVYMQQHHNQYAPMGGVMRLREMIAEKIWNAYQKKYNPETEITITSGATEALFVAISTVVHPGDEVIIFEPAYDSYVPVIELQGGIPIYITLDPIHKPIDWDLVRSKITNKTRAVIVNTPHNPTGQIWAHCFFWRRPSFRCRDTYFGQSYIFVWLIRENISHHRLENRLLPCACILDGRV